jgi:regulator of RNase E activity RraA
VTEIPTWLSSTLAADAAGVEAVLPPWIGALSADATVSGPALVVEVVPDDNRPMRDVAAAVRSAGTVLVVAGAAESRTAILGDLVARELIAAGIVAVVTDGLIRDSREVAALGLPVWARGVTPGASAKNGPGAVGGTVSIGGVSVSDGDIAIADADGVVIWQQQRLTSLLESAQAKRASDDERLTRLTAPHE